MIELFLVRHAIAVERSEDLADERRPLTDRGIRRFRAGVRGLAALGVRLDLVLHSPWLRAVQTAERLAPITDGETEVFGGLAEAPGDALLARLRAAPDVARVACVGHEPWLGELAAILLGTPAEAIPVKKGGVIHLAGEPVAAGMKLVAAYPPDALRRLGRR